VRGQPARAQAAVARVAAGRRARAAAHQARVGVSSDETAEILASVRRLVRFLRVATRRAEQQTGASAAQLFVLSQLAASPASSMGELAARAFTDASSVSTVVARLVARGLVSRRRAAADRRRIELALTRRGRAMVARAPELAQTRIVDGLARLTPRERR